MKLSFSTKGWHGYSWEDFSNMAQDMGFDGIELHSATDETLCGPSGPLYPETAGTTEKTLAHLGLRIPCICAPGDISDARRSDENIREIKRCVDCAALVGASYIRVGAKGNGGKEAEDGAVIECLKQCLPYADEKRIVILIETCGIYSDTSRLRDVLNVFARDNPAALWDTHSPYRQCSEDPETTIQNLGAYIKHVHIRDSEITEGETRFCLPGEGSLPLSEMTDALRSVNYNGFISLEWNPSWNESFGPDIVFPHFINTAGHFIRETAQSRQRLFDSNAGTGKYVWKKDILIEYTLPQVLDRMVTEFPDQCAYKYTTLDYTRTYSEFRDDVDFFARALIALGVKSGDKVAVWATNIPQWYIAFHAAVKIGAVLVTVNTAYKIREADYLLRQSDTHTLIMIEGYRDSDYAGIIRELCPELEDARAGEPLHCRRLPFLRNIITIGFKQNGCLTWDGALAFAVKIPVEEVRRRASAVKTGDVCNMQYTSGTTGFPKGVMLTHYNIVNNGKCIGDGMDFSTSDRLLVYVPMFHCFGMVLAMTAAMTHGSTLLPLPYFSPKPALACINSERITALHGVPTMFIALLEHPDFTKTDFSFMRTGIMAGSPCPTAVMRDVVDKMNMSEIVIVYGQTESSPGCTMSRADDPLDVRVSTVGRAMPEIECKIVSPETGEELSDGVTGEFVARGYNIMKGYYKMPRATKSAIDEDGWLHTGDLACRTPEGNYKITGRLKDMIIRGGENIYPKEIEEFLYTHPDVSDVQVIGVPDEQYGEEIMACVILKEGKKITPDEIREYVKNHMAKHKTPKYVEFTDAFPMNAAGKILKYKMRDDAVTKLGLEKAARTETA